MLLGLRAGAGGTAAVAAAARLLMPLLPRGLLLPRLLPLALATALLLVGQVLEHLLGLLRSRCRPVNMTSETS